MRKMYSLSKLFLITTLVITIITSCDTNQQQPAENEDTTSMNATLDGLIAANDALYAGLNEMFKGNIEPLNNLWSHSESISYMGPFGESMIGWNAVGAEFSKVADMKLGGSISYKDMYAYLGSDFGYTTCVEEGENMDADGNPVSVSHRATNIFQLENGEWRLIHHHTDKSHQLDAIYDEAAN